MLSVVEAEASMARAVNSKDSDSITSASPTTIKVGGRYLRSTSLGMYTGEILGSYRSVTAPEA